MSADKLPELLGRSPVRPEEVGLDSKRLEDHRQRVRWQRALGVMAGQAECVLVQGRVAYLDVAGVSCLKRRTPVTNKTLFRCFSMSKPFTGAAVLLLADKGLLNLDDPVHKFIPSFGKQRVVKKFAAQKFKLEDADLEALDRPVTIRHLLTHTSGLSYGTDGRWLPSDRIRKRESPEAACYWDLIKACDEGRFKSLAKFVDALSALPLRFQPGTRYCYGFGVDVAGRIVEVVSGLPVDRFLRESLFQPLGMTRTAFCVGERRAQDLATMYRLDITERPGRSGRGLRRKPSAWRGASAAAIKQAFDLKLKVIEGENPAKSRWFRRPRVLSGGGSFTSLPCGGLVTCLEDIVRFADMVACQGKSRSGQVIISSKTLESALGDWLAQHDKLNGGTIKGRLPGWNSKKEGWNPLGMSRHKDGMQFMAGWECWWAVRPQVGVVTACLSQSSVFGDVPGWEEERDELDEVINNMLRRRQFKQIAPRLSPRAALPAAKRARVS